MPEPTTTTEVPAAAEATTTEPGGQSTAAEPTTQAPAEVAPESEDPTPGEEHLGDPGKRALDRMKAEKRAAEQRAREIERELAALKAKLEGREAEFAAEQERRRIEAEALAKADQRILKAEVKAAAAGVLNDPADALHYIDLTQFEVGEDGEVDADAIKAAVESLAKSKPYLAAQGAGTVFESPSAHREHVAQITRDQLKGMTPEQIVQAKREGRLKDLGY